MSRPERETEERYCTFCSKHRGDVRNLIAGPGNMCICDECVDICNQILNMDKRAPANGEPTVKGGSALKVPFEIADFSMIAGVPCPCGTSRRAFMRGDNSLVSVHVVEISKDAQAHYHKRQTETYYFLEGEGHMELDGKLYPVKPGMSVMIRPGTRHRAVTGTSPMKILNIVVPPFDPADEWFD